MVTFNAIAADDAIIHLEDAMNNESDNAVEDTVAKVNASTGRVCSEGFYISESTGLCVPECGVWEEFPHSFVSAINIVVLFCGIVHLLGASAVLILSCINYKRM